MTVFLIVRLPSRVKSLEAVEYMQRNHFSFRISSNSSLLKLLISSEGAEGRSAAALGLPDEFKLGDEEKQLIQQFATIEVKEEVDSDVEHQLKNDVDATEVKKEVESDVEQDDVTATEEEGSHGKEASASQPQSPLVYRSQIVPSNVTEQEAQAEPVIEEAQLEVEEPNFLGEMEAEEGEQRMDFGENSEMAGDDVLEPLDADGSTVTLRTLRSNDVLFDFEDSSSHNYDLQMENEIVEAKDGEEDDEKIEEFAEEEEELIEEQEHEVNRTGEGVDEQMDENMDDESMEEEKEEDSDEEEDKDGVEDVSSDEESQEKLQKKKKNSIVRHLFTCFVKNCSFSFKTVEGLEEHMKVHAGKQEFSCDVCKKMFPSKAAALVHIQEKARKECCKCGKKFSRAHDLLRHFRCHTVEKPFVCKSCGKRFSRCGNLHRHVMTHTGEKRFCCGVCKKRFSQKPDVKKHERTHSGDKPYKCKHCDYTCSFSSNLIVHNRKHTGEKPFSCGHCEKRFSQKSSLNKHELTHSGEKPFECSHCERKFTHRSNLNRHILVHTGQKPFSCKKCDAKFAQSSSLKNHLKKKHE